VEAASEGVKLQGGRFIVGVKRLEEPDRVRALLEAWYREKAEERFGERLEICWQRFGIRDRVAPKMRIRKMRSRWGSLSPTGTLTLNLELVRAPRDCIDYVVLHELCHLEYADHSPAFRTRLEQVMPNWERRKHRLEMALR
jgi:predicted metal-dependent hydrolase